MRSKLSAVVLAATLLALTGPAEVSSATPTAYPLHVVKDCSTYSAEIPSYCTIRTSNVAVFPIGAKIWYSGPEVANPAYLSSSVSIDATNGNTTTGYCMFDYDTESGLCAFSGGTGTLSGFHALVHVSIDSTSFWHWDGSYFATQPLESASTPTDGSNVHRVGRGMRWPG